jgi:hypothetical protein
MTDTAQDTLTVLDWFERHRTGSTRSHRERLENLKHFLGDDIGELLLPDVAINERLRKFELANPNGLSDKELPALYYCDERMELWLVQGAGRGWQVAYSPLNRLLPGLPPLERVAHEAAPELREHASKKLPFKAQCFPLIGQEPPSFIVYLRSNFWLHTFIHQLMYELDQSNR